MSAWDNYLSLLHSASGARSNENRMTGGRTSKDQLDPGPWRGASEAGVVTCNKQGGTMQGWDESRKESGASSLAKVISVMDKD